MADHDVAALAATLGEPTEISIPRDNDRDLVFKGWLVSRERDCIATAQGSACTEVAIYMTLADMVVTQVRRWRERDGKPEGEQMKVAYHLNTHLAVAWLKGDNKGSLGATSKKAWVAACKRHPKLTGKDVERIG